jgi:hypothetical protein
MPYTQITYQEFQQVMTEQGFKENGFNIAGEYVFDKHVEYNGVWFYIRVYSSVDKRTNKTRNVGTDAIRVILLTDDGKTLRGNKRVNRVETWKENLQKRLDNWINVTELCPQCGFPLRNRKGKYGDFIGCSAFPKCGFTKKVE